MNAYFMCVLTSILDEHKCNFKETYLKRKETRQCAQIHFLPSVFKDNAGQWLTFFFKKKTKQFSFHIMAGVLCKHSECSIK